MSSILQTLKSALGAGKPPSRAKATSRAKQRQARASVTHSPYRACTIEPGLDACAAVATLREERFLQTDVPPLPLPECGRLQCDCRYRRHEDRRHRDHERRLPGATATQLYPHMEKERRRTHGRRAGD